MRTNAIIVVALVFALSLELFGVPLLPKPWVWILIPIALLTNTTWSAIHESIHGNLLPAKANAAAGRVLACLFGSSFTFLKSGHLAHHAYNRSELEQLDVVRPGENIWVARASYYFFLCGGLFLAEVLVPLAFVGPIKLLLKNPERKTFTSIVLTRASREGRAVALESIASMVCLAVSFALYGDRWPILAWALLVRAFLISSLDYIYHYGSEVGDVTSGYNLALPNWLSAFLLRFNFHHTHHVDPKAPWIQLPAVTAERALTIDHGFFAAAAAAWRGPQRRE